MNDNFNLKKFLGENKLLKEEQMGSYGKFLKVVKSYEDEEILSDFLDSYPKGQDISKSEYERFTEKHLGLSDPEDYRGKNWKYIMSEDRLLNENAPGYDTRKSGEALPTLESVKAAYEAKQEDKEDQSQSSSLIGRMGDRSLKEGVWNMPTMDEVIEFVAHVEEMKDQFYHIGSDAVHDGLEQAIIAAKELVDPGNDDSYDSKD